jgi:hypothetical protein
LENDIPDSSAERKENSLSDDSVFSGLLQALVNKSSRRIEYLAGNLQL